LLLICDSSRVRFEEAVQYLSLESDVEMKGDEDEGLSGLFPELNLIEP
jgi:hypothetical protein